MYSPLSLRKCPKYCPNNTVALIPHTRHVNYGAVCRAHYVLVQNPEDMGFFFSVNYLIFWVFGGSYTFWGPLFGAMFLTILPEFLRFSLYDRFIIYGVIVSNWEGQNPRL